jgi:hypothetical protein
MLFPLHLAFFQYLVKMKTENKEEGKSCQSILLLSFSVSTHVTISLRDSDSIWLCHIIWIINNSTLTLSTLFSSSCSSFQQEYMLWATSVVCLWVLWWDASENLQYFVIIMSEFIVCFDYVECVRLFHTFFSHSGRVIWSGETWLFFICQNHPYFSSAVCTTHHFLMVP